MKLYSHQEKAVSEILYEIEVEGKRNVVLEAPTSFGKSLVLAELAKQLSGSVMIVVGITALIDQIAEHLDLTEADYSILKAGYEDKFRTNAKIQLVMLQTYNARKEKIDLSHVDYVLQDEAHKFWDTSMMNELLRKVKPDARISVSGTPYDSNGYALEGSDSLVRTITIPELEKNGYVSPLKYYVPKWSEQIDYTELRMSGSDYSTEAIGELIGTKDYANLVVKAMNAINAKEKKTIVFCSNIKQAELIHKALKEDGYSSYCYHSKNDSKEANKAMESFKTNSPIEEGLLGSIEPVRVLVSVTKIAIGFSVTDVELGVLCRPTKVLSLFRQMCGRLMRKHDGKQYGEILDLAQCINNHGFHWEPYNPPPKGNKEALVKEKSKLEAPIIGSIVGEEPTEITREIINVAVDELKSREKQIPELDMKTLTDMFELATEPRLIIEIGFEVHRRVYRSNYNEGTIEWATKPWIKFIEDFPQYERRIIKTMKSRIKNIVRDGKKIVSIHYMPDSFLRSQEPYTYYPEKIPF